MRDFSSKTRAFTLVELIVSVVISILVLGGILYFIWDVLLGLARTSGEWYFLDDFYEFTTLFESGKFEKTIDYSPSLGMDGGIISSGDNKNYMLVWVVNTETMKLVTVEESQYYGKYVLWYANISQNQKTQIESNPQEGYNIMFQNDKIFANMYIADLQISSFNSGALHDFEFVTFPYYQPSSDRQGWNILPKQDYTSYRLSF